MQGLAETMAGQPQSQPQQAQPQGAPVPQGDPQAANMSVEDVLSLLMEGMQPEEIEAMGVPQEVIMQAIQILEQELAAESQRQATSQGGGGLAEQMAMEG